MRLWTLHPCCLDPQGLVVLWREGLLAHCWLEIHNQVLNDEPDIAKRFPQLAEIRREHGFE